MKVYWWAGSEKQKRELIVNVKYLRGAFWQSQSLKWLYFPCPWSQVLMPLSSALSQLHIYPLCDSYVPSKTNILLSVFVPWINTVLQGPHIPPMNFTSFPGRGSNLLPPDGIASQFDLLKRGSLLLFLALSLPRLTYTVINYCNLDHNFVIGPSWGRDRTLDRLSSDGHSFSVASNMFKWEIKTTIVCPLLVEPRIYRQVFWEK